MPVTLKTRINQIVPRLDGIQDPAVARALNDLSKVVSDGFRNAYDDLLALKSGYLTVVYFGDAATDGTWRIIPSGNNLAIQRRESGAWVEKDLITP